MELQEILRAVEDHYRAISGANARVYNISLSENLGQGNYRTNSEVAAIHLLDRTDYESAQLTTKRYLFSSVLPEFSEITIGANYSLDRDAILLHVAYLDSEQSVISYIDIAHLGYGLAMRLSGSRVSVSDSLCLFRQDLRKLRTEHLPVDSRGGVLRRDRGQLPSIFAPKYRPGPVSNIPLLMSEDHYLDRISSIGPVYDRFYNTGVTAVGNVSTCTVAFRAERPIRCTFISSPTNRGDFQFSFDSPTPPRRSRDEPSERRQLIARGCCGGCGESVVVAGLKRFFPSVYHGSVCKNCYEDERRNIMDLNDYMNNVEILDYSTHPVVEFSRRNANDPYYLGIELEVNANKSVNSPSFARKIRDAIRGPLGATWYLKKDSSTVNDQYNGCELVTTPQTYDALAQKDWRAALNAMRDAKLTAYKSGLCGLHIHISRPVNESITAKMRAFLVSQQGWLIPFSARTPEQLDRFAAFRPDYRRNWANNYGRYSALNETENTVEFRFFRSTLNYGRFWASVQLASALPLFVEAHSSATVRDKAKCRAAWDRWLASQPRYDHLRSYLQRSDFYRA